MDGILIGDIFGLILALPIALFLAYWLSSVKNHWAVVIGALVSAIIGFVVLYGWASSLTAPGANGAAVFFGSVMFCSIMGLIGGILSDLLLARINNRDYRRTAHEHE
ncbi:MAG TPA: PTS sucrose transporter subunit IIBC [Ktedonosporobacter sp.]|nr:PTS sucrose transporter subunit IIBC [Ktedonosporobacter sp.]